MVHILFQVFDIEESDSKYHKHMGPYSTRFLTEGMFTIIQWINNMNPNNDLTQFVKKKKKLLTTIEGKLSPLPSELLFNLENMAKSLKKKHYDFYLIILSFLLYFVQHIHIWKSIYIFARFCSTISYRKLY